MGGMATAFFDRWLGRISTAVSFWTVIPPGVLAVIGAYLSTGITRIAALGPFGWFTSGLVIFLVSSLAFALIARTKLWRVDAKARERMIGDSSAFDPMATVYEKKRLYIRDLAPAGRRYVRGKKFVHCEIIGPASVVVGLRSKDTVPWPQFVHNIFNDDCDFIEISSDSDPKNAVAFLDCDFDGCTFWSLNLLFLQRLNPEWNWITKPSDQPSLELQANGNDGAIQPAVEADGAGRTA